MTADADINWDLMSLLETVRQQYPQFWPFISQPEILKILADANADPTYWSPQRIQSAIQNTDWYKNNPSSVRAFQLLSMADPASARQQGEEAKRSIYYMVNSLGLTGVLSDAQIDGIALAAAAYGWDQSRIAVELNQYARDLPNRVMEPGTVAATMNELGGIAKSYGLNWGLDGLYKSALDIATGTTTKDKFISEMQLHAMALYPALVPFLKNGGTVEQYAAPYFQLAAQELGINPAEISAADPKWMSLVVANDDKGQQGVNSMQEALTRLRSDPSYGYDTGLPGRTTAAQFATTLLKQFGAMG